MAKAKKLKSGSWRCLVYDYTNKDGKRHYKLFTSANPIPKVKRIAERMAAEYAEEKERYSHCVLTFGEAFGKYIADRELILSASTIREYKRTRMVNLSVFEKVKISNITQEQIQGFINELAKEKSPKTVRNVHGIISAVLKAYRPEMALNTTLPQKIPPKLHIPTDEVIKILLEYIE